MRFVKILAFLGGFAPYKGRFLIKGGVRTQAMKAQLK